MAIKNIKLISVYFHEAREAEILEKLQALISEKEPRDKAEVLRYLEAGLLWWKTWTIVDDLLSPEGKWIGVPDIFTDGAWAWSREIIYYFKNYNLLLPPAFLEHMQKHNWVMPEIDLRKLYSEDHETVWP
jgi:hypothetical protein